MTSKASGFRFAGLGMFLYSGLTRAAWEISFQKPATRLGEEIFSLHNWMMVIILIIFVGVFGTMFYSVYAHRKSKGHQAAQFHENTLVEIVWTVVPLIILILMVIPVTGTVLAMRDTSNPDLTIKATGYQWKWGYDYIKGEGEGIHYMSTLATPQEQISGKAPKGEHYLLEVDRTLVVPVGKKIRLLTTANDVIHSWWVPALMVKQDAIPGFVRDTWFMIEREGTYRGQCAELCGKDHGFMPIVVEAVSPENYARWVEEQRKLMAAAADDPNKTWTLDELRVRGEMVFASNCAACHQASGKGIPGTFPALDGSKVVLGPKEEQVNTVMNGRPGTAMAAFGKQLSDVEIAAAITYTRNSWSNHTGEAVQPAEIKAARK